MTSIAETWSKNEYEFDPNDQRFERKFTTEALSASDLDTILRAHPSAFRTAYEDRWINNIYLDTHGMSCYRDHTAGSRSRVKFRIRWYGDLRQQRAQPVLEIKRKVGMVGSKLRFELPEFDSSANLTDEGIRTLIRTADIDPRICEWVEQMRCMVGNCYRRSYFVTVDNNFRMTVDRELQFLSIPSYWNEIRDTIEDTTVVLELKYHNELDIKVEEITQHLPFRMRRMSKYILGIEQLTAHGQL